MNANTTHRLNTPCASWCLCAARGKGEMREVYGTLEYELDGQKHSEKLVITVPVEQHHGHWMSTFDCLVRSVLEPRGATFGVVVFRLDGSDRPLTRWERFQDFWFRLTLRGRQVTVNHFVPIWPKPPGFPSRHRDGHVLMA